MDPVKKSHKIAVTGIGRCIYVLVCIIPFYFPVAVFSQVTEPVPVHVVEARVAPLVETIPLTGTITSERSAMLSPRVSGLVAKVNVDAGDSVSTGDVLVELDSVLAKLAMNQSLAALNEARSALKEAIRLREEASNLAKSKNIPETTVQSRIADVEMKTAAVTRMEAEYKQQSEIVNRHTVIAPFDGAVGRKLTEVGEWVETGTSVVELVATKHLRLDVQVPQEYFRLITENSNVTVQLDTVAEKTFNGRITAKVPVNNPNARTFLTRIHINDADGLIIPGMSARAIFNILLEQEALQLPRDATIQYPDGRNTVWVITKVNGKFIASEQQVQLGRNMSRNVVIRNGLEPGSIVVVRGNETLQEGQEVNILEQTTADN